METLPMFIFVRAPDMMTAESRAIEAVRDGRLTGSPHPEAYVTRARWFATDDDKAKEMDRLRRRGRIQYQVRDFDDGRWYVVTCAIPIPDWKE